MHRQLEGVDTINDIHATTQCFLSKICFPKFCSISDLKRELFERHRNGIDCLAQVMPDALGPGGWRYVEIMWMGL